MQSRNGLLCRAPPSRLRRAVLPHTKTLAVFPPANPRDRTRLWTRVARVQRRQSSRGRPPSSLVANPFPWPCCYRFNPPVAAALPPLLHSSASPPATARSSSTIRLFHQSSSIPYSRKKKQVIVAPIYFGPFPCANISIEHPSRHDQTPARTPPLPWFPPVTSLPLANF